MFTNTTLLSQKDEDRNSSWDFLLVSDIPVIFDQNGPEPGFKLDFHPGISLAYLNKLLQSPPLMYALKFVGNL